ncbi:hypothetical protein SNEBB_002485 [Seison nebaliae]|nr:hypothetical protein SNEBB_002485 [Seison nebaliae]
MIRFVRLQQELSHYFNMFLIGTGGAYCFEDVKSISEYLIMKIIQLILLLFFFTGSSWAFIFGLLKKKTTPAPTTTKPTTMPNYDCDLLHQNETMTFDNGETCTCNWGKMLVSFSSAQLDDEVTVIILYNYSKKMNVYDFVPAHQNHHQSSRTYPIICEAQLLKMNGIRTNVGHNCLVFRDDKTVFYFCGRNLIIYNLSTKVQVSFITVTDFDIITDFREVSTPGHRYLSISGSNSKSLPSSIVYEMPVNNFSDTLVTKSTIFLKDKDRYTGQCIVSADISPNQKYLLLLLSNSFVLFWDWELNLIPVEVNTLIHAPFDTRAFEVTFHPTDHWSFCMGGKGIFRTYRYQDGDYKIDIDVIDSTNENSLIFCYTAIEWIKYKQVVCGTERAHLLCFESRRTYIYDIDHLLKYEPIRVANDTHEQRKYYKKGELISYTIPVCTVIRKYGSGFLAAFENGCVLVFIDQNQAGEFPFTCIQTLRCPSTSKIFPSYFDRTGQFLHKSFSTNMINKYQNNFHETAATRFIHRFRQEEPPINPLLDSPSMRNTRNRGVAEGMKMRQRMEKQQKATNDGNLVQSEDEFLLFSSRQCITGMQFDYHRSNLLISTAVGLIYKLPISVIGSSESGVYEKNTRFNHFTRWLFNWHFGPITGMDMCKRKPWFCTVSIDRTVRIWNVETGNEVLVKEYPEEVFSVAFHPLGFYLALGFPNKLRLATLYNDDIVPIQEYSIRSCMVCSFSTGGHLIAATMANVVQVFSINTRDLVITLKGHLGNVTQIIFSKNDLNVITCGSDGAVYEWQLNTGKRLRESVIKSSPYNGIAMTKDDLFIYAIGSDSTIKEIVDSNIYRECPYREPDEVKSSLTAIDLANKNTMQQLNFAYVCFVGSKRGYVSSIRIPFGDDCYARWTRAVHAKEVNILRLSANGEYFITVSKDLSMAVWRVSIQNEIKFGFTERLPWNMEILIGQEDLEERNKTLLELTLRVGEMKRENERRLKIRDQQHNDELKSVNVKFSEDMQRLRDSRHQILFERQRRLASNLEEFTERRREYKTREQIAELAYDEELLEQYQIHFNLLQDIAKLKKNEKRVIAKIMHLQDKESAILLERQQLQNAEIHRIIKKLKREYDALKFSKEEIIKQIEQDIDYEIENLKHTYDFRIRSETDGNNMMRGETAILRKKFNTLQMNNVKWSKAFEMLRIENEQLYRSRNDIEKVVQTLRKEIQNRELTIAEKEKKAFELKKHHRELEKFKFVLDNRVIEMKQILDPKEEEIKRAKTLNLKMDEELVRMRKHHKDMTTNITDLKAKLDDYNQQIQKQRTFRQRCQTLLSRLYDAVHNVSSHIQDPNPLRLEVKAMMKRFLAGFQDYIVTQQNNAKRVNQEVDYEYTRQRQYLEKQIATVRKHLDQEKSTQRVTSIRVMAENVSLIRETTDIRNELRSIRGRLKEYEASIVVAYPILADVELLQQTLNDAFNAYRANHLLEDTANEICERINQQKFELYLLKKLIQIIKAEDGSEGSSLPKIEAPEGIKDLKSLLSYDEYYENNQSEISTKEYVEEMNFDADDLKFQSMNLGPSRTDDLVINMENIEDVSLNSVSNPNETTPMVDVASIEDKVTELPMSTGESTKTEDDEEAVEGTIEDHLI